MFRGHQIGDPAVSSHIPVMYCIPAGPRLWSDSFCFDLAKRVIKVYLSSVRVPRTLNKLSCPHKNKSFNCNMPKPSPARPRDPGLAGPQSTFRIYLGKVS